MRSTLRCLLLAGCSLCSPRSAARSPPDIRPPLRRRHGRGRRRLAGAAGARPKRSSPTKRSRCSNIAKGATVADIGAGNGYITWRLAERVGPTGKVYANDIQPEMLEHAAHAICSSASSATSRPCWARMTIPSCRPNSLDLVILVDVYHEFSEPQKMLRRIREALKPDGRLVLLEYRGEDPAVPIRPEHKMTVAQVKTELEPEGYRVDRVLEDLPRQHILIFQKTP